MSDTPVYFVPNNVRPTWPTLDEAMRWAKVNSYPGAASATNVENLQICLDATIERLSKRCHIQVRPVDSAGDVDPDGDPVEVPADVKLAAIMHAVRFANRALTPNGIAGTSEITGLIRTTSYDPDVEALLEPWRELEW